MATIAQLVASVSQSLGLPLWISAPAVQAESHGDPNARNGQYAGLLQIGPGYPGSAGKNLYDPLTNLQVGLKPMADAYRAEGSPDTPSVQAYDYVLTHSGHDQWTGQFSSPAVEQYFNGVYNQVMAAKGGGGSGSIPVLGGLGQLGGAIFNAPGQAGTAAGQAVASAITKPFTDALNSLGSSVGTGIGTGLYNFGKAALPHIIFMGGMALIGIFLFIEFISREQHYGA